MPAPAAVYIIFAVVGAAAATFAFKEFVYEPHLADKFEELKDKARAYYLKNQIARERRRAQPFHFDNDNGDGDVNEAGVELEGLFSSHGDLKSNHDSDEMRLRANPAAAPVTATATAVSPPISKTTSISTGPGLTLQNQRIKQRNVTTLLDLEETNPPITIELNTPSEPTATITTPLNPFVDQNLLPLYDYREASTRPSSDAPQQKRDHALSPGSRANSSSFSPFSQLDSLGIQSPVILSSTFPSPQSQTGTFLEGIPSPNPASFPSINLSEAFSAPAADLESSVSNWEIDFDHTPYPRSDASLLELPISTDPAVDTNPYESVTSPEFIWAQDENDSFSEASYTTDTTTLTSSTFSSSTGSRAQGEHNRGLNPFLGDPQFESNNSLSDGDWERLSDVDRRSHSP